MARCRAKSKKNSGCLRSMLILFGLFIFLGGAIFCAVYFLSTTEINFNEMNYPKNYNVTVSRCAEKYDIDEDLIYAVIRTESNFNESAESRVGAIGLMQIMPETFDWLLEKKGENPQEYTLDDLKKPQINIEYGCYFLRILLDVYTAESTAVAAYNAGFVVSDWLKNPEYSIDGVTLDEIPYSETKGYVQKVFDAKKNYEEIYATSESGAN